MRSAGEVSTTSGRVYALTADSSHACTGAAVGSSGLGQGSRGDAESVRPDLGVQQIVGRAARTCTVALLVSIARLQVKWQLDPVGSPFR